MHLQLDIFLEFKYLFFILELQEFRKCHLFQHGIAFINLFP